MALNFIANDTTVELFVLDEKKRRDRGGWGRHGIKRRNLVSTL
jgi:hypothetical protein